MSEWSEQQAVCQHACHRDGYQPPAIVILQVLSGDPMDPNDNGVPAFVGICNECIHVPFQVQKQVQHMRLDGMVTPLGIAFVNDNRRN